MDATRKGQIALKFLRMKLRELRFDPDHPAGNEPRKRLAELTGENEITLWLAFDAINRDEGYSPYYSEARMGEIALVAVINLFILNREMRISEGLRRAVGNVAAKINITFAEAIEFAREVFIEAISDALRDPAVPTPG